MQGRKFQKLEFHSALPTQETRFFGAKYQISNCAKAFKLHIKKKKKEKSTLVKGS